MSKKRKSISVAENINIKDIHLTKIECVRNLSFTPKKATVNVEMSTRVLETERENYISILCSYTLSAYDEEHDEDSIRIAVEYFVLYTLLDGYKPSKEEIDDHIEKSAIFNSWPFFREQVHRLIVDCGLSPLVLPTVAFNKIKKN